MMTPEARQLQVFLRNLKRKFLLNCGSKGGNETGWLVHVVKDYRERPDHYPALETVLVLAAREAWGAPSPWEKRKGDDDETPLFTVAGVPLDRELTIPDPAAPHSTFRQVATDVATIDCVREDAIVTMTQGARVSAAGLEKMRTYNELLKRAGGDTSALVVDVADKETAAA